MGQVLHGCATTTQAIRRAIQHDQASLRSLAACYGVNKLLPLDDCLYALQPTIPQLTRSSLHRCLQRHGISRLPDVEGDKPDKRKFKTYPLGYFHIDIAEVRTEQGKLYLLVAIDRTTKFAFTELHEKATRRVAGDFLRHLIRIAFDRGKLLWAHGFELACVQNHIDYRPTKLGHPWINGQVERMNRTIKDATVKRFHYDSQDHLQSHLATFVAAYNFGRRSKTLKGLTPYEAICKAWTKQPERFTTDPTHQMLVLNI